MEKKTSALTELFARRTERLRALTAGVKAAGWNGRRLGLLEIGCYRGDAAAGLAEREPFHVTGVDLDWTAIRTAWTLHGASGCVFVCADAYALPFPQECFDGAWAEAVFSTLADRAGAARECARVLRPGGRVLIEDFARRDDSLCPAEPEGELYPCLAHAGSREEYAAAFRAAGFRTVCCTEDYSAYARAVLWLCGAYGTTPGRLAGRLAPDALLPALTWYRMVFEKDGPR